MDHKQELNEIELDVTLSCLEDWQELTSRYPFIGHEDVVRSIVDVAVRDGIESPSLGFVGPEDIKVGDANYRESFLASGFNPRVRVLLDYFSTMPIAKLSESVRIYAPEAIGGFAERLRERYPHFVCSEYLPNASGRAGLAEIRHEDLQALSFPDAAFDVAFCNDVFEHLPDLARSLSELARVLSPGGTLLATFPFAYNQYDTIVRARLEQGQLEFFGDPEYHANPIDPKGGSLVFRIPGWDILDQLRAGGFSSVDVRFVSSRRRGICGAELAGVHFLVAHR